MNSFKKFMDKFVNFQKYICALALAAMLFITFIAVVFRYLFKSPIQWADEFTIILLVWFGFITMSIEVYSQSHIAIEAFYNKFPIIIKKIVDIFKHLMMLLLSFEMAYYGQVLSKGAFNKTLISTHFSKSVYYIPMLIAGVLIFIYSFINLIKTIKTNYKEQEVQNGHK